MAKSVQEDLYVVLQPLAHAARSRATALHGLVGLTLSECWNENDFTHLSEVSALYAYATVAAWRAAVGRKKLVTAAEQQEELRRWTAKQEPPLYVLGKVRALDLEQDGELVVEIAKLWIGRQIQGRGSSYFDRRRRIRSRRCAPQAPWNSWRDVCDSDEIYGYQAPPFAEPQIPQERDFKEQLLQQLETALTGVLNEWEMYVIREHFIRGRRQREIAKELAAKDPKYAGDWVRAEKWVGKTVERALDRARKRLGSEWQELSRECQ